MSSSSGQGSTSSQTVVQRNPVSSDPRPSSPASVGSTPSRTPYPPAPQSSPTTAEGIRTRTTSSSGTPAPTPPSSHRTVSAPTTPTSLSSGSGLNFGLSLGMLRPYLGIVGGRKDQSSFGLSDTTRRQNLSNAPTGDADSDGGSTRDIGGRQKRSKEAGASFTTGLAMLLYNVSYLAYTQGVDIPLAQAGEVLRNLWAICCSPELGRLARTMYFRNVTKKLIEINSLSDTRTKRTRFCQIRPPRHFLLISCNSSKQLLPIPSRELRHDDGYLAILVV